MKRQEKRFFKRGNAVLDTMIIVLILVSLALVMIVIYKAYSEMNTNLQEQDALGEKTKATLSNVNTNFPIIMDNVFIFALFLVWVFGIIASFMIDSHPIFFVITLVLLVVLCFIGVYISNAYQTIALDENLIDTIDMFPKINFILSNLLVVILIFGFTIAVSLFAKNRFI